MKPKLTSGAAEALRTKRGEIATHIQSLKSDATKLRTRIGELRQRREKIIDTPISKEEFIRLSLEWVDHIADTAAKRAADSIVSKHHGLLSEYRFRVAKMESFISPDSSGTNPANEVFRSDSYGGCQIEPGYLILFLCEPIKEALRARVLEHITWPFDNVITDVAAARKEVADIDAELESLNGELAGLVDLGTSFGATV